MALRHGLAAAVMLLGLGVAACDDDTSTGAANNEPNRSTTAQTTAPGTTGTGATGAAPTTPGPAGVGSGTTAPGPTETGSSPRR